MYVLIHTQVETISNEGSSFLDRMRQSSAYQLVQQIKQFLAMFSQMDGQSPDNHSDLFQQFLEVSVVCERQNR